VSAFRRMVAVGGGFGMLAIALAGTSAGVVKSASAAGGLGCAGTNPGPKPGAAQVLASHFRGLSASESFSSVAGNTQTSVGVDVLQESLALAGSGSAAVTAVFVTITVTDLTTGIDSVEASGCVPTSNFQMDQTLTSATLGATSVPVTDGLSGLTSIATVAGEWTGFGALTRQTNTSHFHAGSFTSSFNFIGFDRLATANGTASDSDLNVSFDGAADFAELDKVEAGGVTVCLKGAC